jgi:hypothetical protein
MKRCYPIRCRARLLAMLALAAGDAVAREAAGPEATRAPATDSASRQSTPRPVDATRAPEAVRPAEAPRPAATSSTSATPSEDDAERAKRLYASGAEAFAGQRNADAIRYFRRAAELVPSAKLTYNIGLAYEEMGDTGRALAEYRSYLLQDREADAGRADEVRGRIANLERRLAETGVQQLFVTSEPPGATVRVDGRARGVTPWAGELAPGQYRVELDLPGYGPRQAEVTLAPDRSGELSLDLPAAAPGTAALVASRPRRVSALTWTFLGVGAGALAGGVAFELSRASSRDDADRASDPVGAAEARGAADAKQMASILMLGFGAGFTIGGAVLLALDLSEPNVPSTATALGLPCTAHFCGVMTQGHF